MMDIVALDAAGSSFWSSVPWFCSRKLFPRAPGACLVCADLLSTGKGSVSVCVFLALLQTGVRALEAADLALGSGSRQLAAGWAGSGKGLAGAEGQGEAAGKGRVGGEVSKTSGFTAG